ncbi:MAG: hydrogenase iron-sulfur subunit [Chloroflexi bacterium]|nr:hydrogenase iron-sulfur subunit [Chloroflexota bacterium]
MTHHVETKAANEPQTMPPCQFQCPLHQDIRGYIALVAQGRLDDAAALIRETNPLPSICGTICAHPCEEKCRRLTVDDALSIRGLKRYIMENAPNAYAPKTPEKAKGKKVAIIGSGPGGLTAAHDLALMGFKVTVFERSEDTGGAVRWGVPSYRLPVNTIKKDVDAIKAMGVEFKLGMELGKNLTIDDLEKQGYGATLLMMGLSDSRGLPIPNNNHQDVLMALPFLRAARNGQSMIKKGSYVVVIGSGNVAMDVARTAVRLGAGKVKIACLEKPHEMPASPWEIEEAIEEGIEMQFCGWGPNAVVLDQNNKIKGLECRECVSVFDEQKRFNPKYNDANLQVAEGDTVIFAIGQGSIINYLKDMGIKLNERGLLVVDPKTFMTSRKGVFSGGEIIKGPGPAVAAMAHARKAALAVAAYLDGTPVPEDEKLVALPEIEEGVRSEVKHQDRQGLHLLRVDQRINNFTPIETGFTPEEAAREARRCMSCGAGAEWIRGKCAFCLNCVRVCPFGVPVVTEGGRVDIRFDQCQGCGICYPACPGDAIGFRMTGVAEVQPRMQLALKEAKSHKKAGPTVMVLYCDFDAYDVTNLRKMMKEKHKGTALVSLPCLAKLKALDLMRAFEYGADAVLVIGCPNDDCAYPGGEEWAAKHVAEAKRLLGEIGMDGRLEMRFVSGLKIDDFDKAVAEFAEKVKHPPVAAK